MSIFKEPMNKGTFKTLSPGEARDFCEVAPQDQTSGFILGRFPNKDLLSIPQDGKRIKRDKAGNAEIIFKNGSPKFVKENLNSQLNRHTIVTGTSGSGKTHCVALPAIFQAIHQGESVVVTDPKGELFYYTSNYAKQHGYTIKVLNLANPSMSDSWDLFTQLKDSSQIGVDAQKLCGIIINNTNPNNIKQDEVYVSGEENLLTALVLYVLTAEHYRGPKTIGAVYDLLCKDEETLDALFCMLPENSIALRPWSIFKGASPALRSSLIVGAGARLQALQDEVIKDITGYPEIDLIQPGRSKCAYYVILPDMMPAYKFISSAFISCLIDKLTVYSRTQTKHKLPVPVNVIMDEFHFTGRLDKWDKVLATVGSVGINITMIIQSLPQLQFAYPNGVWALILATCYTFLCLSCNDLETATYLVNRSETARSNSKTEGERATLKPEEVYHLMKQNNILISLSGADLIVADKFSYTEMIDPAELTPNNICSYTPSRSKRVVAEDIEKDQQGREDLHLFGQGHGITNSRQETDRDTTSRPRTPCKCTRGGSKVQFLQTKHHKTTTHVSCKIKRNK